MDRLIVDNLNVHYGAHHALNNVSFHVKPSEVIGIIGSNGAGKSTLIRAICGATPVASGEIILDGEMLSRKTDRRDKIGFVPQSIGLYPYLTARENLSVFGRMHGLSGAQLNAAIDQAFDYVGMAEHADKLVRNLSGGMQRRINVAAAILHGPSLLILDEPTAGTDIAARDAIHKLVGHLAQSEMSILIITHELREAAHMCDRIAVLHNGALAGYDAPQTLLGEAFGTSLLYSVTLNPNTSDKSSKALLDNGFLETVTPFTFNKKVSHKPTELMKIDKLVRSLPDDVQESAISRPDLAALLDYYAAQDQEAGA